MKWFYRQYAELVAKLAYKEIQRSIVRERVRIWNEIHRVATVQVIRDGLKDSHIVHIGVPKLEQIVLPELPKSYSPANLPTEIEILPGERVGGLIG